MIEHSITRRNLLLSLVIGATWLVSLSATAAAQSPQETIVFLGDSITAQGGYVRNIDAALKKQNPKNAPRVIGRGRSSETVSGLSEAYHPGYRPCLFARLDKILKDTKPTWVVACYGINCGIYHPYDEKRFAAYKAGIEKLVKKTHASGARLVLLTAPPYARSGPAFPNGTDAATRQKLIAKANAAAVVEANKNDRKYGYRTPYPYYDSVMARYAKWLETLDTRDGVWVINLRTAMLPRLKECYNRDPIHPNGTGHGVMAASFLAQWPRIRKEALKSKVPSAKAKAGLVPGDAADMLQGDKTLVAWVAPTNLTQRNVGVLTQDNMAGSFDGIIFGELFEKKWMAGSNWFQRTERDQKDWPVETAGAKTFVQIAITYKGNQVTIYRNGKQYARYVTRGAALAFGVGGVVVIGRHNADPRARYFAGQIDDARIYDVALSAEQVAALRADAPSDPKPWAWWTFDNASPKDRMGRFDSEVTGGARIAGGKLLLDGKDDSIFAVRAGSGAGPLKAPPAPKEFANVFSVGYGTVDHFPKDPAGFEKLLVNLKGAGYNTIHCVYSDARLELCRKHGMKIMIDVLAWKEGAQTDIRRPRQQAKVQAICRKVRGDNAVWGYNLWNERLDKFSPGGIETCNRLLYMLRKWDTTHPVWVGTYLNYFSGSLTTNPGCYGYYDYHWQRGMKWHFSLLKSWKPLVEKQDAYLGRWILRTDYNKCMYTLNTSIAYGLKTCIWFICGPWHPVSPKWNDQHFLCRIGREMRPLWAELGKIGRPLEVYSTPTVKAPGNQDKTKGIPAGRAIPDDFWMQVKSGEALLGHFKYDNDRDAVYLANHNAVVAQKMVMEFKGKALKVEMFDRKTGKYVELKLSGRTVAFDLKASGGELLRVSGRGKK